MKADSCSNLVDGNLIVPVKNWITMEPIESDELEFLRTFRDHGIVVYDPTRTLYFQKPLIVKENQKPLIVKENKKDGYDKSDGKYNKSER